MAKKAVNLTFVIILAVKISVKARIVDFDGRPAVESAFTAFES